jgi:hypothetical protein
MNQVIDKNLLLDGKIIKKEKDRIKEINCGPARG